MTKIKKFAHPIYPFRTNNTIFRHLWHSEFLCNSCFFFFTIIQ